MSDRGCLHDWTSDTALNKPPQLTIFRIFSQLTAGGIENLLWLHWERLESGSIQTSSPVSFPFTHFALYPFTVRNLSHWCSVLWILPANYQNWSALGRPLPPVHYSLDVLKNFLVGRETLKKWFAAWRLSEIPKYVLPPFQRLFWNSIAHIMMLNVF